MTYVAADVERFARSLAETLKTAQAQLADLRTALADGAMTRTTSDYISCPLCGVKVKGPRTLAEHQHVAHGTPHPDDLAGSAA